MSNAQLGRGFVEAVSFTGRKPVCRAGGGASAPWGWLVDGTARAMRAMLMAIVVLFGGAVQGATLDPSTLMDWAERTFPDLFPGHEPNQNVPPYVLRYYPRTGNYVGVADGMVYVYGPLSTYQLVAVGRMSDFECQVLPANCVAAPLPRLHVADFGVATARDATGRIVGWGSATQFQPSDGPAISGTIARVLSPSARQILVGIWGGLVLTNQGTVEAWGNGFYVPSGGTSFPLRKPITLPGQAVDMALNLSYFTAHVLLGDGTVWEVPGVTQIVDGLPQRRATQVSLPLAIRSFSRGIPVTPYLLARDGTVWRKAQRNEAQAVQVAGATDINEIHCGVWVCVGVRASGSAVFWAAYANAIGTPTDSARPLPFAGSIRQATAASRTIVVLGRDGLMWDLILADDLGIRVEAVQGMASVTDIACHDICIARKADGSIWQGGGSRWQAVQGLVLP